MNIREYNEELERKILSPYAALSAESTRLRALEKCEVRTEFQRDRDKIIHSKAFRRLKHKTQVFITPEGDHYRTRLTHTLEVTQIARTIARALRLNEDLTEAMSLGHDLGHTPFGHEGEYALNEISPFGFRHNEQSLRVVDCLEGNSGLNLTCEVRDGILNHTGDNKASTLEGAVLKFADRIAYINHDIDDAIRGGILRPEELPSECVDILGDSHSKRIDTMIKDVIANSSDKNEISMSNRVYSAMMNLRKFMFERVYVGSAAKDEGIKATHLVQNLYNMIIENPDKLPKMPDAAGNDIKRLAVDYIAGMTDTYAIYIYKENFIPKRWYK